MGGADSESFVCAATSLTRMCVRSATTSLATEDEVEVAELDEELSKGILAAVIHSELAAPLRGRRRRASRVHTFA